MTEIKQQPGQYLLPILRSCPACELIWGLASVICPDCNQPTDEVYEIRERGELDGH